MDRHTAETGDTTTEGRYTCSDCGTPMDLEEAQRVPMCLNCSGTMFLVDGITIPNYS